MRLGGNLDRIIDIFGGSARSAAARVFEAISCPADSAKGPEDAHDSSELGGNGLLDSEVAAPARGPQPLSFEQASGAFPEGVIGQLVRTGHVSCRFRRRRSRKMAARIRQQPASDRDIRRDLFYLAVIDELLHTFAARLPCHDAFISP